MKALVIAATTVVLAAGGMTANAQNAGPYYSDTIHQSAGDRDSRGYPKYYQRPRTSARRAHSTTGAGYDLRGEPPGPYYSDTIHQSAGDRDSRGYPKYYGHE